MRIPVILLALGVSLGAGAQLIKVAAIERLKTDHPIERAQLSPAGDFVLLSNYDNSGLVRVDLKTRKEQLITAAPGAGYRTQIMANGDIVYREVSRDLHRQTSVKLYNAATGKTSTVLAATRDKVEPVSALADDHVMTTQEFQLELTLGGQKRILSPLGTGKRYLWPSISPDGKRLLWFVSGDQAYVSRIDGSEAKPIGVLRAAKWYNNNIVIGQRDTDDGTVTTESYVIARDINSTVEQRLAGGKDMIAMYPSASADGSKILFTTPDGSAHIININVK